MGEGTALILIIACRPLWTSGRWATLKFVPTHGRLLVKKSKTNFESWDSMLDRSMPSMSTTTDLTKRPSSVRIGLVIRLVVTTTNATWTSKFSTTTTIGRRTTIGLTNGWRS